MSRGVMARWFGFSVFALLSWGGIAAAQTVQQWPHDANYVATIATCRGNFASPADPGKLVFVPGFSLSIKGFSAQAVFGTTQVTLGPFLASNDGAGVSDTNPNCVPGGGQGTHITQTFVVTILARTPLGTNPSPAMTQIGQATVTLAPGTEQSFFVNATLPAVLSAVDVQVAIPFVDVTGAELPTESVLSADCATLSDAPCLQAAINPIGMLSGLAPVTILYEPPGSCSYAQFTASLQPTT
jgi:hypothetical protein